MANIWEHEGSSGADDGARPGDDADVQDAAPVALDLTFAAFAAASRERCQATFGRTISRDSVMAMVLGLAEEAGEVAGAVRGYLGISARKAITVRQVGDEIADVVCYADLLAQCLGLTLSDCLVRKFNAVSDRAGSPIRLLDAAAASEVLP